VFGAVVGAGVGYVVWIRQRVIELRHGHDVWLRNARLKAYRRQWKALELLALFAPPADVTQESLSSMATELRQAYFASGMLMTNRSRDTFLLLQEGIDRVLRRLSLQSNFSPLRGRDEYLDADQVDDAKSVLNLRKLDHATLTDSDTFHRWHKTVQAIVRNKFTTALPTAADEPTMFQTFVLLQFLASSFRSSMSADINSREAPVLEKVT
jgi:hypothetical protein